MYSKDKHINIQQKPTEYYSLDAAYSSISQQYHPDFVCQVVNTFYEPEENPSEIFYVDVMDKEQGNWVGYLGVNAEEQDD